jgi:hypothetical protein
MLHCDVFPFIDETGKLVTNSNTTLDIINKKFNAGSANFAGSSYLSLADSDDWCMGTGDYTIDFWFRLPSQPGWYPTLINQRIDGSNQMMIRLIPLGEMHYDIHFLCFPGIMITVASGSIDFYNNTWYHMAVVRYGDTTTLYVNGIAVGNAVGAYTYPNFAAPMELGGVISGGPFVGNLDEVRISKGIARWTSNFIPPTVEYSGGYEINDLIILDETFKEIVAYEDVSYDLNYKKFGDSSLYFPAGLGDFIATPGTSATNFLNDNFTIDFWMRDDGSEDGANIMGQGSIIVDSDTSFVIRKALNSKIEMAYYDGTETLATIRSSSAVFNGSWHHVAIVRNGTSLLLFVDGIKQTTKDITGFSFSSSTTIFTVGRKGTLDANYYKGNIDELRISKGIARWTNNFVLTPVEYSIDAYTFLLLHCNIYHIPENINRYQGYVASLSPDEYFIITHPVDPSNQRLVLVSQRAEDYSVIKYFTDEAIKYTYDAAKIEFLSDGAQLKAISSGLYPTALCNIKTNVLSRMDSMNFLSIQSVRLDFAEIEDEHCDTYLLFSFDAGTTWKMFDGAAWQTVATTVQGTTIDNVYNITPEQWAEVFVPGSLDVIVQLKSDGTATSRVADFVFMYSEVGYMPVNDSSVRVYLTSSTQTKIKNIVRQGANNNTIYNVLATVVL